MSARATGWTWEHSPYKANKKLIHLAVADVVNEAYGHRFFMRNAALAEKCDTSRQTVNSVLAEFVADGYLRLVGRLDSGIVEYEFLYPEGVSNDDRGVSADLTGGVGIPDRGVSANPTGGVSDSDTEQEPNPTEGTQGELNNKDRQAVWDAYVASLEEFKPGGRKPKFSPERQRVIDRRLKDYSVEDLVLAVTGWSKSDFHRGKNDGGKVYNDIKLSLRSDEKIEQFIGYHEARKPSSDTISQTWGSEEEDLDAIYGVEPTGRDWDDN